MQAGSKRSDLAVTPSRVEWTVTQTGKSNKAPSDLHRSRYLRPYDGVPKTHQALDRYFHLVARLEIELSGVGLAHRNAARRAHSDEIAGLQRHITREMLNHVGDLVDELTGILAQPPATVYVTRDPE